MLPRHREKGDRLSYTGRGFRVCHQYVTNLQNLQLALKKGAPRRDAPNRGTVERYGFDIRIATSRSVLPSRNSNPRTRTVAPSVTAGMSFNSVAVT
jgi:hypothetical protein